MSAVDGKCCRPSYGGLRWRNASRAISIESACGTRMKPPFSPMARSEEHTSELQSLMRISYAVFCLKKKKTLVQYSYNTPTTITKLSTLYYTVTKKYNHN